jgi:hypothetical protein
MAAIALILTTLAVAIGSCLGVAAMFMGHRRQAGRRLLCVAALMIIYSLILVVVSLISRPRTLAWGQWKCFDNWCVTVASSTVLQGRSPDHRVTVYIRSTARRRAQRPDNASAFLLSIDRRTPIQVPGLRQRLEPGQTTMLQLTIALPTAGLAPQLLITEGGFPSHLVIGDENSPWHAKSSWSL